MPGTKSNGFIIKGRGHLVIKMVDFEEGSMPVLVFLHTDRKSTCLCILLSMLLSMTYLQIGPVGSSGVGGIDLVHSYDGRGAWEYTYMLA